MVGNSDESGWRSPPARRGISRSPPQWPQPVFIPYQGGSVTENAFGTTGACFAHRVSLKMRRVPEEAFLSTACIFRTPEGPPRYRMPTTQPPNHIATTAHPALRYRIPQTAKKEEALQKRSPECRQNPGQGENPVYRITEKHVPFNYKVFRIGHSVIQKAR